MYSYGTPPPSQHAPGLESWGFVFRNADGKTSVAERHNVRSYQQAYDGLTAFVKANLIKPIEAYRLPHMP